MALQWICIQVWILEQHQSLWNTINSSNNFAGRSFLCLPSDPDHVLQADLQHEHLLHDEEHAGHCVAVLPVDCRPDRGGGVSGGREGEGEKGKEGEIRCLLNLIWSDSILSFYPYSFTFHSHFPFLSLNIHFQFFSCFHVFIFTFTFSLSHFQFHFHFFTFPLSRFHFHFFTFHLFTFTFCFHCHAQAGGGKKGKGGVGGAKECKGSVRGGGGGKSCSSSSSRRREGSERRSERSSGRERRERRRGSRERDFEREERYRSTSRSQSSKFWPGLLYCWCFETK